MTPSEAPKALQASECSELLDLMRASCWITAQHKPGKFIQSPLFVIVNNARRHRNLLVFSFPSDMPPPQSLVHSKNALPSQHERFLESVGPHIGSHCGQQVLPDAMIARTHFHSQYLSHSLSTCCYPSGYAALSKVQCQGNMRDSLSKLKGSSPQ